jgi:hypothetical protein
MDEVRDALREHDERQEPEPDADDARDAEPADDGGSDDA